MKVPSLSQPSEKNDKKKKKPPINFNKEDAQIFEASQLFDDGQKEDGSPSHKIQKSNQDKQKAHDISKDNELPNESIEEPSIYNN